MAQTGQEGGYQSSSEGGVGGAIGSPAATGAEPGLGRGGSSKGGADPIGLGPAAILPSTGSDDAPPKEGAQTERARRVREMFGNIAHAYDLNNHLLSANTDHRWRRRAVKEALAGREESTRAVLDCCSGTGDLALALAAGVERHLTGPEDEYTVIGADFTPGMLERAEIKTHGGADEPKKEAPHVHYCVGDSLELPFATGEFDLATVAFGIRNVADLDRGLHEMARVLRPGGRIVILEFSPIKNPLLRASYNLYFTKILPWLGGLIARRPEAYKYLAHSVENFLTPQEMSERLENAGFDNVRYKMLTLGVAALHLGEKK